ncbi:MAG: hypothetical protein RLZ98_3402, partial [Pseudomonadota bacterium]
KFLDTALSKERGGPVALQLDDGCVHNVEIDCARQAYRLGQSIGGGMDA